MSEQDNVVNLGAKKPVDQEKVQAAAAVMNNAELPDYMLNQIVDDEFPVITDTVQLPSKGVFYKNKQGSVKIKHLTAEDENILTSADLIRNGKVLDVLLDNAIIDSSLNADDMLVGDRNAVLMYLRKEGYGDDYEVKIGCPSCSEDFTTIVKISDIEPKLLETTPDSNGEFLMELPKTKWKVKFRLLNGKDENYLAQLTGKNKKGKKGVVYSNLLTERFLLQIMEVNGNRDKLQIKKAISNMPALDSLYLREYVAEVEPGLRLETNYTCTNCSHNFDGDIPITPKLFWPNAKI
jgi:hypothetical protein